jgi:hypothetical protein
MWQYVRITMAAIAMSVLPVGGALAKSLALVIGNDGYLNLEPLAKARSDAQGYAVFLSARGFDVHQHLDVSTREMAEALAGFYDRIEPGDTVVVVYAGHGWSDGRENYLVPVDARASGSQSLLALESVPLRNGVNGILDQIAARSPGLTVAVIDACRNNPFTPLAGTRSIGLARGLTPVAVATGTFVAFSAGEGQTALDRLSDTDMAPYSVFTRVFLEEMARPQDLQTAFKATQARVNQVAATVGHSQRPAYYDEVVGLACLSGSCVRGTEQPAAPQATQTAALALPQPFRLNGLVAAQPAVQPPAAQQPVAQQPVAQPVAQQPIAQSAPQPQAPAPDPVALAAATQGELNRLGCHAGQPDGRDTNATRAALSRFAAGSGRNTLPGLGSTELLTLVRAERRAVCAAALHLAHVPDMLTGTWNVVATCGPQTELPGFASVSIATLESVGDRGFLGEIASNIFEHGRFKLTERGVFRGQIVAQRLFLATTWHDGSESGSFASPSNTEMSFQGVTPEGCTYHMVPAAH